MQNDILTQRVIGCCFDVHQALGPGFPEKLYQSALKRALGKTDVSYLSEEPFRVSYDGIFVGLFKVDLLIDRRVIVEIKAVSGPMPKVFESQLIAYLKAARLPVGLLVNFGNSSCQIRRLYSKVG